MFNNPIRFMYEGGFGAALGAVGGAGGAGSAIGAATSAIGAANPLIAAGLGLAQGVYGAIKAGKAEREMKQLLAQRKAYKTPEEVYMQLQATQQNAGQGLGSDVLSYLTTNANNAFSSGVGAMTALGGNPNDIAGLFEKRVMDSMSVAGQNQAQKMANFSKYLGALGTVAENRTAEWQSRENMLKDQIQAASASGAAATQNIQGGLNSLLAGTSAAGMQNLYNQDLELQKLRLQQGVQGVGTTQPVGTALPSAFAARLPNFAPPRQIAAPELDSYSTYWQNQAQNLTDQEYDIKHGRAVYP